MLVLATGVQCVRTILNVLYDGWPTDSVCRIPKTGADLTRENVDANEASWRIREKA